MSAFRNGPTPSGWFLKAPLPLKTLRHRRPPPMRGILLDVVVDVGDADADVDDDVKKLIASASASSSTSLRGWWTISGQQFFKLTSSMKGRSLSTSRRNPGRINELRRSRSSGWSCWTPAASSIFWFDQPKRVPTTYSSDDLEYAEEENSGLSKILARLLFLCCRLLPAKG